MSGHARLRGTVRFGEDFELDFDSYRLRRGGGVLKLERIPMEILLLLVERRRQVVSREQIVERIWSKDVFLDTDNSINGAIRKIRQVLQDDSDEPRFIQTITGHGYRFIAPVVDIEESWAVPGQDSTSSEATSNVASENGHAAAPNTGAILQAGPAEQSSASWIGASGATQAEVDETPGTGEGGRHWDRNLWLMTAGALGVLLIAVSAGYLRWSATGPQSREPHGRLTLAVLPFQNLTGDASQEYVSDGLTEEMITHLGSLDPQHWGVIARTSVMHYKSSQAPLDQIARELGVQYVIEGSVWRDADHVRVTAQIIQAKDQTHLWARQYDRESKVYWQLQGEIAQEIADEIQLALGDHKPERTAQAPVSPENYQAYDLYLKGLYFFNKRTVPGFEEAIRYFEQAATKDPSYARAYAGLADSYALIGGYGMRPQSDYVPKARAAALKALEIDESLPEGHAALALIVQNYDWDWQTAEREFRRAIELSPNYATAHHWYAEHLMWRGRFDEAFEESERARQLDPLSLIIATDNGAILYFSRQYDRAIEKWRSVLDLDPDFPRAALISFAYVEKGMFTEALASIEAHRSSLDARWYWVYLAYIYGRSGQKIEAQRALDRVMQLNRRYAVDPFFIAYAYAGLGDNDRTLAWLERAYAQHSVELASLRVNPIYDLLRGDPRFQDLMRRIHLAQ